MNTFFQAAATVVVLMYGTALAVFCVGFLLPFTLAWSYNHHLLDLAVAGIVLPIMAAGYLVHDHAG